MEVMNSETEKSAAEQKYTLRNILRALIGLVIYIFFVPALLFIAAGTVRWPVAWAYVIMLLTATIGSRLVLLFVNRDLLSERGRFTDSEGTKTWDKILAPIIGLYGPVAAMLIAGLDHRYQWTEWVPVWGQITAAGIVLISYALAVWAMMVNRYFSSVARIQTDRDQQVITSGPYRIMRHPSYIGGAAAALAFPFMLDTLWALLPGLVITIALIIRTYLEDKMLIEELNGYADYTRQTRFRWIPGIW
jgi:protein-S-isoprenylcysteine O-methyltransferase Ste14